MGYSRMVPPELADPYRNFHKLTFPAYAEYVHRFTPAPFQMEWSNELQNLTNGRLVIVAPPESGKTAWCIAYCAWLIGRDPTIHIGYVGNTIAQALRQSVAVRDTVRFNPRYREVFPRVRLDDAKGTAERDWFVRRDDPGDKDATFIVSGYRGPLLGARLDVLVLDDYSDMENTATPEQQERAWDWLQQNAITRLNPDTGRIVAIQTRWADGDVVGRLTGIGATLLHFPALDDLGNPLWPERWRREGLDRRRLEIGSRNFDLHYQGLVVSRDAEVFKPAWWRTWQAPSHFPTGGVVTLSIDTAAKTGLLNDYSAATVWSYWQEAHYLIHAWRDRLEFPDLLRTVEGFIDEWRPRTTLIEDAGVGTGLIQELKRRGRNVLAVQPTADKLTRAIGVTHIVEAGKVLLPTDAGWLEEFRYECEAFPRSRHDDWVDTVVHYLHHAPTLTYDPLKNISLWGY